MAKLKQERLNEIGYNKAGDRMIIIEYNRADNIIVRFDNGLTEKTTYQHFKEGSVVNPINKTKEKLGQINYNMYGSKMTIIKYISSSNIIVEFENGYRTKAQYYDFKRGLIKNPYDKTVYNIGFIGEGKYKSSKNGKGNKIYRTWLSMLERCYSEKFQEENPTYIGCIVCDEWHNFQNFGKFFDKNYYTIEGQRMAIDKDILHKGNKLYSPKTCVFVPENINSLFVKRDAFRGNLPIGVHIDKRSNRYIAQYANGKRKTYHIGSFGTSEEAFYLGYKPYKEKLIKQIANEYKDKIPEKLYNAMISWRVEITD